jgi:hypothetical protein
MISRSCSTFTAVAQCTPEPVNDQHRQQDQSVCMVMSFHHVSPVSM